MMDDEKAVMMEGDLGGGIYSDFSDFSLRLHNTLILLPGNNMHNIFIYFICSIFHRKYIECKNIDKPIKLIKVEKEYFFFPSL